MLERSLHELGEEALAGIVRRWKVERQPNR